MRVDYAGRLVVVNAEHLCAECGHFELEHDVDGGCWYVIRAAALEHRCTCLAFVSIAEALELAVAP